MAYCKMDSYMMVYYMKDSYCKKVHYKKASYKLECYTKDSYKMRMGSWLTDSYMKMKDKTKMDTNMKVLVEPFLVCPCTDSHLGMWSSCRLSYY